MAEKKYQERNASGAMAAVGFGGARSYELGELIQYNNNTRNVSGAMAGVAFGGARTIPEGKLVPYLEKDSSGSMGNFAWGE